MLSHRLAVALLPTVLTVFVTGCGRRSAPETAAIRSNDADAVQATRVDLKIPESEFAAWRNGDSGGVMTSRDVPVSWTVDQNVLWKAQVPGEGHSSPVVWGEHVFLTTADEPTETQRILAFEKETGDQLWQTTVHTGSWQRMHRKNSQASSTPACDGTYVFAAFVNGDGLHVTACDFEGTIAWQQRVGPFESEHGYGSSVVMWKGLLFVCGDSPGNGYLVALNRTTGDIVWRTPREGAGRHGNYATPIVAELAGRPQLVHAGYGRTISYDPASGEELWRCAGPAEVMANAIAHQDPFVVVSGGYPEKEILCIRADGSGDVTDTHIRWRADRGATYVPSPTILDDRLVSLADDGILTVYAMDDGKRLLQKRLGGNFSASPLAVGKTIYVPNESGEVLVFKLDPEYELISENRLDNDGGMASLAVSNNQLFVRTSNHLYCLQ